jgi:hypothetical protein
VDLHRDKTFHKNLLNKVNHKTVVVMSAVDWWKNREREALAGVLRGGVQ